MPSTRRNRPSTRLIVLLVAVTVVPMVSLLGLGHFLLDEDRRAAKEQKEGQLQYSADLVSSAVDRAIAADEQRLAAGATNWDPGAVVVTFSSIQPGAALEQRTAAMSADTGGPVKETASVSPVVFQVTAVPAGRVAFLPVVPALREADAAMFEDVDRAEFQQRSDAAVSQVLEPLTGSTDSAVQATARLRFATHLDRRGDSDRALALYKQLTDIQDVAIAGTPVGLVAMYRRCAVLARLGRTALLRKEAAVLHDNLIAGRWKLTSDLFALYLKDADIWEAAPHAHPSSEERFAAAVQSLWLTRDQLSGRASSPQRFIHSSGGAIYTVLWQPIANGVRALVASPAYALARWKEPASKLALERGVSIRVAGLEDSGTATLLPPVVVQAAASALPWNLNVQGDARFAPEVVTGRGWLLIGGLAVLITMALASSYFIARAVHREIAIARLQSSFVAAVSHEFRTPLTTLRQFTEMLREGSAATDEHRKLCYDAQTRATDRLTRLVESVLDFGSMEAGKRRYRFEVVSCAAVVRAVVDEVQREVETSGYRIEPHLDDQIDVAADSEALGRAVRNLLENAVKYSPDERTVHVDVVRCGSQAAIAVRDRGIGVASSERKKIFDQFHRGTEAQSRGIAGTGIGLAMVDHIVRAHRGRVEIESTPGAGSTFTILLPLAVPVADSLLQSAAQTAGLESGDAGSR